MSLSGISQTIARIPVPPRVQDFFLWSSKPGPDIYPLEASVMVGRSIASQKRGGFLELQERLPEEIGVAFIWLKGVEVMANLFDRSIKPHLFTNASHLDGAVAWNWRPDKARHLDLTPQELYTQNRDEIRRLLQIKSMRWALSVGFALSMAAYVIPKANQLKTDWVLRHFYNNKPGFPVGHLPNAVQRQHPPDARDGAIPYPAPGVGLNPYSASGRVFAGTGFASVPQSSMAKRDDLRPINQRPQVFAPDRYPPASRAGVPAVQFGGAGFSSMIQGMGHLVDQTPYGSILVVDSGIVGGRGAVASKRSIFETVEVAVRDVGSLYFYILCAPHLMKLLAMPLDSLFRTDIQSQPKMAEEVTRYLADKSQGRTPTPELIRHWISGDSNGQLMDPSSWLKRNMRQAPKEPFMDLLEKEAAVYLNSDAGAVKAVEVLKAQMAHSGEINTEDVSRWLSQLGRERNSPWTFTPAERANFAVAIKQAFRHTVGVSLETLENRVGGIVRHGIHLNEQPLKETPSFDSLWDKLSDEGRHSLEHRILKVAAADGLNQANTMLLRSLNVARPSLAVHPEFQKAERLSQWMDKASNLHLSVGDMLKYECETIQGLADKGGFPEDVMGSLKRLPTLSGLELAHLRARLETGDNRKARAVLSKLNEVTSLVPKLEINASSWLETMGHSITTQTHAVLGELASKVSGGQAYALLTYYRAQMPELLSGRRVRLFSMSLAADEPVLTQKVRQMLVGGLLNDSSFLRKTQVSLGHLTPDSKLYDAAAKRKTLQKSMETYTTALLKRLEGMSALSLEKAGGVTQVSNLFYQLNQKLHFTSRLIAMGGAMWGLGWLVPKVQYSLTHHLTGKNINPGIASAENAVGLDFQGAKRIPVGLVPQAAPMVVNPSSAVASSASETAVSQAPGRPLPTSWNVSRLSAGNGYTNFEAFRRASSTGANP